MANPLNLAFSMESAFLVDFGDSALNSSALEPLVLQPHWLDWIPGRSN